MLISEKVEIKWNSRNKKHYIDRGYVFTKMKEPFYVNVNDLTDGSDAKVLVQCDYCGKQYEKAYNRYLSENRHSYLHDDCCGDCKKYKIVETCIQKNGVTSNFLIPEIREKIANTNLQRYGAENVFASDEIKQKIYNTNVQRYGTKSPLQNRDILEKVSNTCMSKYGVKYYIQTQRFFGADSPRWKGGVEYHRVERATTDYINWRIGVYQKDNYTCQCCGAKSSGGNPVYLNVHHIFNWKDYPDLRYDINNGITLCKNCHTEFHSEYGKKNNNKSQIEKFIFNHGKKIC